MAHLPTVRHYYAVYMAGRGPLLPFPDGFSFLLSDASVNSSPATSSSSSPANSSPANSSPAKEHGKRTYKIQKREQNLKKYRAKKRAKKGNKITIQIQIQNSKIAMAHGGG